MLRPNLTLKHEKRTGTDIYGAETMSVARFERCAIIKLKNVADKTSVRTDASASRGYADEFTANTRILVMASTQVEIGDRISLLGFVLRVRTKHPRFNIAGKIDHYEVEGEPWG